MCNLKLKNSIHVVSEEMHLEFFLMKKKKKKQKTDRFPKIQNYGKEQFI